MDIEELQKKVIEIVNQGIHTLDNDRYVRYFWEITNRKNWINYEKGGGFRKWFGFQKYLVCEKLVRNQIGQEKITYTDVARGSMGARLLPANHGFDVASPGLTPINNDFIPTILAILNSRLSSYILRSICPSFNHIGEGYVNDFPLPKGLYSLHNKYIKLPETRVTMKRILLSSDMTEAFFDYYIKEDDKKFIRNWHINDWDRQTVLLSIEAVLEKQVFNLYSIDR